jgi:hypothetical protein
MARPEMESTCHSLCASGRHRGFGGFFVSFAEVTYCQNCELLPNSNRKGQSAGGCQVYDVVGGGDVRVIFGFGTAKVGCCEATPCLRCVTIGTHLLQTGRIGAALSIQENGSENWESTNLGKVGAVALAQIGAISGKCEAVSRPKLRQKK